MQSGSKGLYTVVLLGTSGVGKSSIAFYLEHGYPPPRSIKPTIAFGISHIVVEKSVIGLIDVGGQRKFLDMRYHERFVRTADGLIFVVDSSQRNFKYDEQWLEDALELISDNIPIVVIANKQDLPNALSPKFLKTNIFDKIMKNYSYHIFGTVAADPGGVRSGENVEQAFKYLINKVRRNRKVVIKQRQV
ncbi:MAG: GTP-binding protein [Candidatus Heimdallarchaeota archaeon]|nr:MAG: GTP-binding protein [Candidatus Heimdallarchaeota archaeon]